MNNCSDILNELFSALSKAQGQIRTAVKDSANPYFKSQYTSLDGCWDAARVPLSSNGLSIIQTIREEQGKYYITTVLGHSSGQYICSTLPLLLTKIDPQSFGSACSYARRYALCAIVGLTQGDDDDGEKAMIDHRNKNPEKKTMVVSEINLQQFCDLLFEKTNIQYDFHSMSEYLIYREKESGVAKDKIIEQALKPKLIDRFVSSYQSWYEAKFSEDKS
jgi:hypothetical protein